MIEGIGEEVITFFVILTAIFIVYLAWISTNVREIRREVGLLIIENNRGPLQSAATSAEGTGRSDSQLSNRTETEEIEAVSNVIEELEAEIGQSAPPLDVETESDTAVDESDEIIRQMDSNVAEPELRRRIVVEPTAPSPPPPPPPMPASKDEGKELRIKLKYLNDDLKLVTGRSGEAIGDFKRRNFSVEIAAQKLVRLVFNGHVLQPDSKTLEACGLYDNCVVHCLIHNQKPSATTGGGESASGTAQSGAGGVGEQRQGGTGVAGTDSSNTSFLSRPENGRYYLYIGMLLVTVTLIFCWFCRFQYNHLFSFYSTVGLVLMSVLFLAMIPLIILIERDVIG